MYYKSMIRAKLAFNQKWLERGILAIDDRQTQDEQDSQETRHNNKRGWNYTDATPGSEMARYIRHSGKPEGTRLSGYQAEKARKFMLKYAGQLARIANKEE